MAKKHPCVDVIKSAIGDQITEEQAQTLIDGILKKTESDDLADLVKIEDKIKKIGDDLVKDNKVTAALQKRNALLQVATRRRRERFISRFGTMGKGIDAFINGLAGRKRLSVSAQAVSLQQKYLGGLLEGLEKADLIGDFRSDRISKEIFTELWHINDPGDSVTGNSKAYKIAQIIKSVHNDMIPRENRAGAFIKMVDNYVMRQTHDRVAIRKAGGMGFGKGSAAASFKAWSEFILPLLDHDKTFINVDDKLAWLKNVHEGILSGVHGVSRSKLMGEFSGTGAMAKKASAKRLLHFKDADSAFRYNEVFGSRSLSDGIIGDIRKAAHNTAVMENFGPNPRNEFDSWMRQLKERARSMPDDHAQLKSLESGWLRSSFDGLMGDLDRPHDPTLHNITKGLLAHSTLSKLGSVLISAIPDKAFFHMAGTYQGWSQLDAFLANFDVFAPKSSDDRLRLLMMDATVDAYLGEIASRFTANDNTSGRMFRLQQSMFKINGMSWWDKVHKGTFAKHTSAWLGVNASKAFDSLPMDLKNVLGQFDIDGKQWDAIRSTVFTADNGHKYITPDQLRNIPDETIAQFLTDGGDTVSPTNIQRYRDRLDAQVRAYFSEQIADAVVTPGNRERVMATLGTQAGTAKGSAARLLMHFKSFPISVWERVVKRELFGHGDMNLKHWFLKPNRANFRMAQLIALTTMGGYVSMAIKDALKGRTPRRLMNDDGTFNWKVALAAMKRGGGLGIYSDFLFTEYDRSYNNALSVAAGPILGQVPEIAATVTDTVKGKNTVRSAEKLALNNTPYINLFYIRPVLDYSILWHLQEALNPGAMRNMERAVEEKNNQGFFVRPSEVVAQ